MADDSHALDVEIIQAAYAEKVKEAFRLFAENIGVGENEKTSRERFLRSLEMVRRARAMALDAIQGVTVVEPSAPEDATRPGAQRREARLDQLSPEDQALIEQALAGTTGQKSIARR